MRISDWSSDVCSSDLDDSGVYVAVATSTICVNRTQPSPSQQLSPPMPKKKPSTDDSFATAPVDTLNAEQAVVELGRLAALIAHHDRLYHEQAEPETSDPDSYALPRPNAAHAAADHSLR